MRTLLLAATRESGSSATVDFEIVESHDLHAEVEVGPRKKLYIGLQFFRPEEANAVRERRKPSKVLQAHL